MRFTGPKSVDVVEVPSLPLQPGQVRVRTIASGVSAGTELTAYRGTNPYLTSTWDPELRLFRDSHPDSPSYPLDGWGYSEVGEVVETAAQPSRSPATSGSAISCGASGATGRRGWWRPMRSAATSCRPASTPRLGASSASAPSRSTPSSRPTAASATPSPFSAKASSGCWRPLRLAQRRQGDRRRRHRAAACGCHRVRRRSGARTRSRHGRPDPQSHRRARRRHVDRPQRFLPCPARGRPVRRPRFHGGCGRLLPGRGDRPRARRGVPPQPGDDCGLADRIGPHRGCIPAGIASACSRPSSDCSPTSNPT